MTLRTPPPNALPAELDLRQCRWFQTRTIGILNQPDSHDLVQSQMIPKLVQAFREQGHSVFDRPSGIVNLMIAPFDLPDDSRPLLDRIPERQQPLGLALMRDFHLERRPDNLVVFVTIHERLAHLAHMQVVELARRAMARIGTPKIVFLSGNKSTGRLDEATFCTMEGGHPTDTVNIVTTLRDRLISASCAREVGNDYQIVEGGLPTAAWENTRTPEALIEAGHRMAKLQLLPPPRGVSEYVSSDLARIYQHYLGMKGFSEGMLFAFDPATQTMMVTASGSWDVDKRALKREEIVAIGGVKDGKIQVLAPKGIKPKGPSVEALEMYTLLMSVPSIRLRQDDGGKWVPDPTGPVTAPIIRSGVHVHVGVTRIDENWVENVGANRHDFPYGFGCGTDLMKELAMDAARRSRAIMDPTDPRLYVRWPMLYHGETTVELFKPHLSEQPLEGLLDMYDPDRIGAIEYTADNIKQE